MSEQVNLLKTPKVVVKEKNRLLSISFLFLLLTFIVTIGMLIYLFFLKNLEASLINSQNESIVSQDAMHDRKIIYQSTKERLLSIQKLLQTKDIQTKRITEVLSVIPQSINISQMNVSGNIAKMTLSSPSLSVLNEFLERNLEELPKEDSIGVRRIQIDSLGIQGGLENYSVGVTIEFK